ncbi:hypothetical protein [Psychrobacter sp. DAB_AL32B]|uniref:hypothetical protein n=1 Tax=Psychrobacter sp. DAB_AL32B TaxID=1028414 RepID=UPI000B8014F8|nr:hypothetical protein [Psychrobacter sp. DAB_AL32B]OXL24606.1 hypothetical protein CAN34_05490 [Psychrobacter sp. DAB_AL32B]
MEYLLLGIGILAGILALALLGYLARMLWRFGKHLKVKVPALWYIYSGFWILLLLIVLVAVFGSAITYYSQEKEKKAKHAFLDTNSKLIDSAVNDLVELKYLSDRTFYIGSDVDELASCIPSLIELEKNYDNSNSGYFDLSYAIGDRAEELGDKSTPWNNLTQKERDRISLKIIDCDKVLGLLTDDEYERQKRLVLVKIQPIPKNEIKKEIESLREMGMNDAEIMDALLIHKDFGANLQLLAERFEDTGSIDPLYGVGNRIGLNTHDTGPSADMAKLQSRLDEYDARSEATREAIANLNTSPAINYSQRKSTPPVVKIEKPEKIRIEQNKEGYELVPEKEDVIVVD